ncbi:Mediator of RNA polymerase II transcription subunit 13 [Zalerion maritima]|uniref:Mediator of RNA polymerase II transcription subunit 13 n=1 Tax=Zalerion maritima TaxID=339359 RepID=A0AAD5RYB9_9PEZI|nr:Mediator of RNA polymerase II transcription subunit 13 [Zalerion maritima]
MDTGEYDTNTLLINNIKAIGYRLYDLIPTHPALIHSILADVENSAKNDGHLVFADHGRRGLWAFFLSPQTPEIPYEQMSDGYVKLYDQAFALREDGSFEAASLVKSRIHGANSTNTPNSSSSNGSGLEHGLRTTQAFGVSSQGLPQNPSADFDFRSFQFSVMDSRLYNSNASVHDVYEYFVSALLSTLTLAFARRTGAIPLNSRSLALPLGLLGSQDSKSTSPSCTIVTFRMYVTTTGALVISLSVRFLEGLLPLGELGDNSLGLSRPPVLIAPLGLFANVAGLRDAESPLDAHMAQSPDTQITLLRNQPEERIRQWRLSWTRVLESRGISPSIIDGTSWVSIQFIRVRPMDRRGDGRRSPLPATMSGTIWPSILCFSKRSGNAARSPINRVDDTIRSGRAENYDPLSTAKTWLAGTDEREAVLAQRKREREIMPREAVDGDTRPQSLGGYPPLILRRTSNTRPDPAVVSAMYPTPPTAVQNPANGITPSFDGMVSSPPTAANTTTLIDLEAAMSGTGPSKEGLTELWDAQDKQRSRAGSLFDGEPENLFGDIGEDRYADVDVTDADFNFFDSDTNGILSDLSALGDFGSRDNTPQVKTESTDAQQSAVPVPENSQPVFAKPELKHARSTLEPGHLMRDHSTPNNRIVPVKRQLSPFNRATVYKRVRASIDTSIPVSSFPSQHRSRTGSVFEKVEFDPFLSEVGKKYAESGRFECPHSATDEIPKSTSESRVTDFIKSRGKIKEKPKELSFNTTLAKAIGIINGTVDTNSKKHEEVVSDADDSSVVSDPDDPSIDGEDLPSPVKSAVPTNRALDDDRLSVATSLREADHSDEGALAPALELSRLARGAGFGIALSQYFSDHEPLAVELSLGKDDFIVIAQILTDQAATGSLRYPYSAETVVPCVGDRQRELAVVARQTIQALQKDVDKILGDSVQCQLRAFIEVSDVPLIGQPTRSQSRPNAREDQMKHSHLFPIAPPHLELRRIGSRLSVLPTAVSFWESLGLGPSLGTKDVLSVCVFPEWEGMADNANVFLERMLSAYQSLKLGSFSRIDLSKSGCPDGILGFEMEKISTSNDTVARVTPSQNEKMGKLAHAMASSGATSKNFVVFFLYDPDSARSIVEACIVFQVLFQMYQKQLSEMRTTPLNELVLQLVPLGFIASPSAVIIPPPPDFVRLAVETYDRCTMFKGPMPAPSILLEKPLSKGIDFKLTTNPSASLLRENSCIHVAYAQSTDDRWVSAAWTDTRGSQQHTASYCLGKKGQPLSTTITDVSREIWDTTAEIISAFKVHWRVIVTKCGPMTPQELANWQELGSQRNGYTSLSLTLMIVDTSPSLQLIPPSITVPSTATGGFYSTPVSTPQPGGIRSPDQHKDNATAGDILTTDVDSKTTLIDISDQTWGAILAHRLNMSASLTELSPSLVSGYLIKHGGPRIEDPPVVMEVNIIHSEANARLYETLLKEMLGHYRALGSLSRARGTTGPEDVRPWHIAAAEKSVRALYLLMS